jgi:hypothetical protein
MAVTAGCLWIAAILLGFAPARAEEGMARTARVPALATPGVCYATLGSTGPNGGSLITIDLVTGAGTLIGPTGIAGALNDVGVPALAIKTTGEMYALDIGPSANLYQLDAVTGSATLVATTGLSSPPAAAFDGNNLLYVVDSGGSLFTVDDVTGVATLVGATGIFPKGFDFSPVTGVLWATDASSRVYTINPMTAVPTLVGSTGQNPSPDLAFDQSGALFASSGGGLAPNNLLSINTSTGVGTIIGSIGFYPVSGMSARLDRVVPTGVSGKDGSAPGRAAAELPQSVQSIDDDGVHRA